MMSRLPRETNPTPGFKPAILPSHQKTNGTLVITGENNPLPTANYVQNQSGLWVPVNQDNPMPISGDVQLTGRNVKYKVIEHTRNDEVVAGGTQVIDITVSSGKLLKVSNLYVQVNAVSGATSGTQRLVLGVGDTLTKNKFIDVEQSYNNALVVSSTRFSVTTVLMGSLTDPAVFRDFIKNGLYIGENNDTRLRMTYINNTDVSQTATRLIRIWGIEEDVL